MDIYDQILNDSSDSDEDTPSVETLINKLNEIHIDVPKDHQEEFNNDEINIISNEKAYKIFTEKICSNEHQILSPLVSTMITLSGVLKNALIDDKHPEIFECNDIVIAVLSNYGEIVNPKFGYGKKTVKRSSRGRKPSNKKEKSVRKKLGSGKFFNSQLTFIVRVPGILSNKTVHGFLELPFKIFKQNKLQFPGATPDMIGTVLEGCSEVMKVINAALHPEEKDPEKLASIVSLVPCMKNYKFYVRMEPGQIIDLMLLKKIILYHKNGNLDHDCEGENCKECMDNEMISEDITIDDLKPLTPIPEHPPIFNVTYTGDEDIKLFIQFMLKDKNKKVRVNIFPGKEIPKNYSKNGSEADYGGKINILGGYDEETTSQIYNYLLYIFETYGYLLITYPVVNNDEYIWKIWDPCVDNIAQTESREEIWRRSIEFCEKNMQD